MIKQRLTPTPKTTRLTSFDHFILGVVDRFDPIYQKCVHKQTIDTFFFSYILKNDVNDVNSLLMCLVKGWSNRGQYAAIGQNEEI